MNALCKNSVFIHDACRTQISKYINIPDVESKDHPPTVSAILSTANNSKSYNKNSKYSRMTYYLLEELDKSKKQEIINWTDMFYNIRKKVFDDSRFKQKPSVLGGKNIFIIEK